MVARKKPGTQVAKWDEELAKQAEIAAAMESKTGGGQFFSTRGGRLQWQDSPLPNNEMAVVILDGIFENVFYEGKYDPDTPQSPTCFAFSRTEEDLAPHIIVSNAGQAQSLEGCAKCEHNEFGSADTGRGKACRNTRRLAMVPAGTFNRDGSLELFDDPTHYETTAIGLLKLPVTSVKGYANFVKQVAGALKRPPFGIITRVHLEPDAKTQFKVVFTPLEKLPDELMGAVMARREEVMATIDFPYQLDDVHEDPPARSKKPAAKSTAKPALRKSRKY